MQWFRTYAPNILLVPAVPDYHKRKATNWHRRNGLRFSSGPCYQAGIIYPLKCELTTAVPSGNEERELGAVAGPISADGD